MDGLLIVDKPSGPTSHDVVARLRRCLGERRIGHTGTLDPAASGVLPIVLGRATRLARFLSAGDKSYDAIIRLGIETDTYDARGTTVRAWDGPLPSRDAVVAALGAFRGTFLQQPPAYSAKKIDGRRSYTLARRGARGTDGRAAAATASAVAPAPPMPAAVNVTVRALDLVRMDGACLTMTVDCSAGFYIRSLAHDLGRRLGTGAHLFALRRTRSAGATLDEALPLDAIERDPSGASEAVVPLWRMLPEIPSVTLSAVGVRHAVSGREIGHEDVSVSDDRSAADGDDAARPFVRLLSPAGELVGIATRHPSRQDLLHPSVVLM